MIIIIINFIFFKAQTEIVLGIFVYSDIVFFIITLYAHDLIFIEYTLYFNIYIINLF